MTGSLILFDVDHFKHINDRFGHDCGDLVLQGIATSSAARCAIRIWRRGWGGEEFLVLLPQARTEVAWGVAERIRQRLTDVTQSLERGPARSRRPWRCARFAIAKPSPAPWSAPTRRSTVASRKVAIG